MIIRECTVSDLCLLAEFATTGVFTHLHATEHFDPETWVGEWMELLESHQGILWVAEEKDQIRGVMGATYDIDQFDNNLLYLTEEFWAITSDTMTTAGLKLLNTFMRHAEQHHMTPQITIGEHTPLSVHALLPRLGFEATQLTYTHKGYVNG